MYCSLFEWPAVRFRGFCKHGPHTAAPVRTAGTTGRKKENIRSERVVKNSLGRLDIFVPGFFRARSVGSGQCVCRLNICIRYRNTVIANTGID